MKHESTEPTPTTHLKSSLLSRREAALYLGISEQTLAIWKCTKRYTAPIMLQKSPSLCFGHLNVADTKCHIDGVAIKVNAFHHRPEYIALRLPV